MVAIAISDWAAEISGTPSQRPRWCSTSFTPMNTRIAASPAERYTSRSRRPVTRKKSARSPRRAKAFATKTM
jgi:hypothetical protein